MAIPQAKQIQLAAAPNNYSAADSSCEAHLVGVDESLQRSAIIRRTDTLEIIGKGAGGTKTTTAIRGDTGLVEIFGVGDELYLHWVPPDHLDITVNPILIFASAPEGSEAGGKLVSWEVKITKMEPATLLTAVSGTVNIVDAAVPTTQFENNAATVALTAATYLSAIMGALHIRLKRVASSNDPVGNIAIHHAAISYGIVGRLLSA